VRNPLSLARSACRRFVLEPVKHAWSRANQPQPWPPPTTVEFPECVKHRSALETFKVVARMIGEKQPGAYLRFGDGEIRILHGNTIRWQTASEELAREMKLAFCLPGDNVLRSLCIHSDFFGKDPRMGPRVHQYPDETARRWLALCYQYFIGSPIWSAVAFHYVAVFHPETAKRFMRLVKDCNPVLVANEAVPPQIARKVFDADTFVKAPPLHAYSEIDRLERETLDLLHASDRDFKLVILAVGPAAKILANRLIRGGHADNAFIFDYGSMIDAFCGWDSRSYLKETPAGFDFMDLIKDL